MAYTREQIERAVSEWRQRLGLERWNIRVKWADEIDDGVLAQISPNPERYSAMLELAEEICGLPAEEIHELAAHEMLHLHTFGIYQTARMLLSNAGTELQTAANDVLHREWELVTDALASALAPILPIPDCLCSDTDEPFRITE
jgi:hypothetical protein